MIKYGLDVSYAQGKFDWSTVKKLNPDSINFAIVRAGYGNNNIDAQAKRNFTELNRLGIPAGAYWFSYAYTRKMAANEAKCLLDFVKSYKIEYPLIFDFEYASDDYAKKMASICLSQTSQSWLMNFVNTLNETATMQCFTRI